jgi:hypothetical protein
MLPRRSARGWLSMTRITCRKTLGENGLVGVPPVRAATAGVRPGSEVFR